MNCNVSFPPATPLDDQVYTISFVNDLPTGAVVDNATVQLLLKQGVDPDPALHLIGSFFITGDTMVSQRIRSLVAGCIYSLSITATDSLGFDIELNGEIICEAVW